MKNSLLFYILKNYRRNTYKKNLKVDDKLGNIYDKSNIGGN
ncbi:MULTISPECIES: hypothetical protein [Clostridium]|uniref:Uncharacterized protein n=1 Tax=Clostridium lapidicellarium TaxID=3240931 RepID=A0ABV4DWS3_9CLOT|nr:hypothetical protein [uncultured Clostridium sp.]